MSAPTNTRRTSVHRPPVYHTVEERYLYEWRLTGLSREKAEELRENFLKRYANGDPYIYLGKALDTITVIRLLNEALGGGLPEGRGGYGGIV